MVAYLSYHVRILFYIFLWVLLLFSLHFPFNTTALINNPIEHKCFHSNEKLQQIIRKRLRTLPQLYTNNSEDNNNNNNNVEEESLIFNSNSDLIHLDLELQKKIFQIKKKKNNNNNLKNNTSIWKPIRIVVDTSHLKDPSKICTFVGQIRPDFMGSTYICTANDIMTREKLWIIENIILPEAIYRTQKLFNVIPIQGPLFIPNEACGPDIIIPINHIYNGIINADIILYAHAGGINNFKTPGITGTIAWASYCASDQFNRPIVGQINFVPSFIITNNNNNNNNMIKDKIYATSNWSYEEHYIRVIMHELFHALGFTPNILAPMIQVTTRRGKKVQIVTAPAVIEFAAKYLNCSKNINNNNNTYNNNIGVELEDEGGVGTMGTHWERREWKDEIMSGIPTNAFISELTLSFFNSLNFYKMNTRFSEQMKWGYHAGCDFIEKPCNNNSKHMGIEWCNISSLSLQTKQICTRDRTEIGFCNIGNISYIPSYFQYFPENPNLGGLSPLMDYCPIVVGYSNRQCRDSSLNNNNNNNNNNMYGFYYGPQSRCIPTKNMIHAENNNNNNNNKSITNDNSPRCLRTRCLMGKQVQILVGETWLSCPSNNSSEKYISIPKSSGYIGEIYCEPAELICSPEIYYNPHNALDPQGPAREYALDLILIINSSKKVNHNHHHHHNNNNNNNNFKYTLGQVAINTQGKFFVHLQQDLSLLCSCEFGSGIIRILPEYIFASIANGGLVIELKLAIMIGNGSKTLESIRNKFSHHNHNYYFTIGSMMNEVTLYFNSIIEESSIVNIMSSEILPEVNIIDGPILFEQLVFLADFTIHCSSEFHDISLFKNITIHNNNNNNNFIIIINAAKDDISKVIHVTPNLIQIHDFEIKGKSEFIIKLTVSFPPIIDNIPGGVDKILQNWLNLFDNYILENLSFPALSSVIQYISTGIPISIIHNNNNNNNNISSKVILPISVSVSRTQPTHFLSNHNHNNNIIFNFYAYFVIQIVILILITLLVIASIAVFYYLYVCCRK